MFSYTSLPPVAYALQPGPPSSYTTSHPLVAPTVPTGFTPSRVTGMEAAVKPVTYTAASQQSRVYTSILYFYYVAHVTGVIFMSL